MCLFPAPRYIEGVYTWFETHQVTALSQDGFVAMLGDIARATGMEGAISEPLARELYSAFDVDGDRAVTFREVVAGLSTMLDGTPEARLLQAFRAFDADRSGTLDPAEMTRLVMCVSAYDRATAEMMVGTIFTHADKDGNRHLDFNEVRDIARDGLGSSIDHQIDSRTRRCRRKRVAVVSALDMVALTLTQWMRSPSLTLVALALTRPPELPDMRFASRSRSSRVRRSVLMLGRRPSSARR